MSLCSRFGVDLNESTYELHPSAQDSSTKLQGSHCSTIRFSDDLSSQLLRLVASGSSHAGMRIGSVQFATSKRGTISLEAINPNLSECAVTVTKEANINTEVYETEYDRPPSNAMFLRRKGFVHSKLIIKPAAVTSSRSPRSMSIRGGPAQKRATTTFKAVKGGRLMQHRNKKRQLEPSNNGARGIKPSAAAPPSKRRKANITLFDAACHILLVGEASFYDVQKRITSRTALNVSVAALQAVLSQIAQLVEPNYRIRADVASGVNWRNSVVLTQSEKQTIIDREQTQNAQPLTAEQKLDKQYSAVDCEAKYMEYDEVYKKKFATRTTYLKSVNENQAYFKQMRSLIKGESSQDKRTKMMNEFRKIFEERKKSIREMKNTASQLGSELDVIKKRMDEYVQMQQQRQMNALRIQQRD